MGLAASQARLMSLTERKNTIGCKLMSITRQKASLSNAMQEISYKYQESFNAKTLKWSDGYNYKEISYANLMYPKNSINNKDTYMITDMSGRVVVDDYYKKYAEMLSPDGKPGDWMAHRVEILSELVGLDEGDFENAQNYFFEYLDAKDALEQIKDAEPEMNNKIVQSDTKKLLEKVSSDWVSKYTNNSTISKDNIPAEVDTLKLKLGKYFLNDRDKFEKACDNIKNSIAADCTAKELLEQILGAYQNAGGKTCKNPYNGEDQFVWYNIDTSDYTKYVANHNEWQQAKEEIEAIITNALGEYNNLITADKEAKIQYYDRIFSSMAEKGWAYYQDISDSKYLNEMLQNGNQFTITEVNGKLVKKNNGYRFENAYDTNLAKNCDNVIEVNDSEENERALAEYNREKAIISAKENKLNTLQINYETEQAAIKQMIEGIRKVMDENVSRTFTVGGGS